MSKRKKPLPPRPPPKRTSPAPVATAAARAAESASTEASDDDDSSPEIRVEYAPAGRDTMAAIAEDVARAVFPPEPVSKVTRAIIPTQTSSPDLSFELAPAGRETLSAIVGEARAHAPTDVRAPMTTIDYDEPIDSRTSTPQILVKQRALGPKSLAEIEKATAVGSRARVSTRGYADSASSPEIQAVKVGRDTLEALGRVVGQDQAPVSGVHEALEIFEMVTFVIRGDDLAVLSSETLRRRFVEERLLSRLPVRDMAHVDRVDVTPWTVKNTVVLRVWCRLPAD